LGDALLKTEGPLHEGTGENKEYQALWYTTQATLAASHSKDTSLTTRLRRLAARKGKRRAIVTVAHTILGMVYPLLKAKQPYRELGADFLDRRNAEQGKRYLLKRLESLGLQVTVRSSENIAALLA
jgi:transposase